MNPEDLDPRPLLESWVLTLRAERKAPQTVSSYLTGMKKFIEWCEGEGLEPRIDRRLVAGYTVALLDEGKSASTAIARQKAVRRFTEWALEEGEIDHDPLIGLKPPKLDLEVIEPLTDDEIRAMLKVCSGTDFKPRRDEALLRLMVETGIRAGEAVALEVDDLNLLEGTAIVRRGKGGKGRLVPFGPQTASALGRYKRKRAQHKHASSPSFWLGDRGRGFSYYGLHKSLSEIAEAAGIARFHPHLLRHTAAHRWLAAGGSEQGIMAVAGWARPDMLMRYTKARASDRAAAEARALNLGDI